MVKTNYVARSRRFRRFRRNSRRRYNRMSIGRKALMQAQRALRITKSIRPNMKLLSAENYSPWATLGSPQSGGASPSAITTIPQGDGINQRVGNAVTLKTCMVEFIAEVLDSTAPIRSADRQVGVRLMLVQVHDYKVHSSFPTIREILEDAGTTDGDVDLMTSRYRSKKVASDGLSRDREFTVLANRSFWVHEQVSGGDQQRIMGKMVVRWPKGKRIQFDDATGSSHENPIVLYRVATNNGISNISTCRFKWKNNVWFYGD